MADSITHLLNFHKDVPQRPMMSEQFNLPRTVEKNIILSQPS